MREKGRKQGYSRARDPKVEREASKEGVMINSVERGGKVKKDKSRNFHIVDGMKKIVMDAKEGGFGRVEFPEGRLKGGDGRK